MNKNITLVNNIKMRLLNIDGIPINWKLVDEWWDKHKESKSCKDLYKIIEEDLDKNGWKGIKIDEKVKIAIRTSMPDRELKV